MCRRRERASADRRVRSGPACWSVPAEQNAESRRTAPAKQLRQWRSVRNFSPENPPCCVRALDTGHSITPEAGGRRSKTKPRRVDEVRSGSDFVAKGFYSSERARLIQDQAPTSNVDSKIHSSQFDCCVFLLYSFRAVTFATKSARLGSS